jgi:hypothetical protein
MLTGLRNRFQGILRRVLPSAFDPTVRLDRDEQTRLSWAKRIDTYDAVPKAYRDFFEPFLAAGREFPYTVQGPSYEGFFYRSPEKLICDTGSDIVILDRNRNTYNARCYPLGQISYVELRSVLLDSYVKISGVTKEGMGASSSIRFNSVTDYLFTPIIERIRLYAIGAQEGAPKPGPGLFDHLIKINYKFMNYGRRSMLGGEKFIQFILQPEIRTPIIKLFGRTYDRSIFPTHMSILTDKELIMIREEARQTSDDRYGGIWDFFPLKKIETLTLRQKDSNLLELSIQLPENEHLETLYQAAAKQDLDQFLERYRELFPKK